MDSAAYVEGFVKKCSEMGVDPEALSRTALDPEVLSRMAKLNLALTGIKPKSTEELKAMSLLERLNSAGKDIQDAALHQMSRGYHGVSKANGGPGIKLPSAREA